jgi:hypothetical protein
VKSVHATHYITYATPCVLVDGYEDFKVSIASIFRAENIDGHEKFCLWEHDAVYSVGSSTFQKDIVTYTGYVCGSVTNNSTWVRIGYRIYSLW